LTSKDQVIFSDGDPAPNDAVALIPTGERGTLELYGGDLQASERRLLSVIAAQIDAALEYRELSQTASEIGPLTENDRMRSALLAAVGHDLRRPLAAATAAVTGLRSPGITWSDGDREELLSTAQESLESLSALVTNLLDVSRLQAGSLAVSASPIDVAEVVLPALDELGLGPGDVELDLRGDLPAIVADAGLLQRVLVNLLDNAQRYAPEGHPVRIAASKFAGNVEIRIVDEGPGVPSDRLEEIFVPFQRLGDTDNLTGLGLGLALSKGFTEGMGGTLAAEETPGGGLSMVISLPSIENVGAYGTGSDAA
jgi:two-component system sensor histidine kinase KdpD